MLQIDYDIDDIIDYYEVKFLSKKTVKSYEQILRLFAIYLKNECEVKEVGDVMEIHIREYIKYLTERGKYIVIADENIKKLNFLEKRDAYKYVKKLASKLKIY